MADLFKNKIFINTLLFLILAELLSFLGYYYPLINSLIFFLIIILTIGASLYRLEYGLYALLAELFIGSFGYLFYFDSGQAKISIRLALWLIIMSVWLAKIITEWLKTKKTPIIFSKLRRLTFFILLFLFIAWGLINGLLSGNLPGNIFFDFNNWLYFLLILPVCALWQNDSEIRTLKQIFLAAIIWLSVKTIILAYCFTHNLNGLSWEIYSWIRLNGLGEITQTAAGFSRVFMQSHIFVLIGFFILLFYLLKIVIENNGNKIILKNKLGDITIYILLVSLFLSTIIISFSRSFWIGLAAGGVFVWLAALFKLKIKFKQFIIFNAIIFLSMVISLILTLAAIKFPYPSPYGGFNPAELLGQRVTQITDEAGASSRWQLLTPLWQKIKTAPMMGQGFGTTVTYQTSDPRVLASNPSGFYTTYAFEWGWLDIWLKLGLFGLLAYLILFIKIIKDGLRINSYFSLALITGLIVLMAVNIFSPYVNHPLGIGYLIVSFCLINSLKATEEIKKPAQ